MVTSRKLYETNIMSFISESPFFVELLSDLKQEKCKLSISIHPSEGIVVKVSPDIPHWEGHFAASHPATGGVYSVTFADGAKGMVNIKPGNTCEPWCKLTDGYKDTTLYTFDDAVEALYASIVEYGNPENIIKK